jgi:hypothetical protein
MMEKLQDCNNHPATVLCPKGSLNDRDPDCRNLGRQDCSYVPFQFKVLENKGETEKWKKKGAPFCSQQATAAKQFGTRLQPPCPDHFLEIKGENEKALHFAATGLQAKQLSTGLQPPCFD